MTAQGNKEGQTFRLGDFEGPLDLLLHLIQKSQINIYDIPIAQITEQYLQYLALAARVDLDSATEFTVMAATLLLIKSRMLLPDDGSADEDYEDPRQELVEKLLEYQRFRRISELVAEQGRDSEWILDRRPQQQVLPFPDEGQWDEVSVWDLLTTFSSILSGISAERIIDLYEEVSVNEKVTLISETLENRREMLFSDLLRREGSVLEVVCTLIAVLEMVKLRVIVVQQNKLFGDIRITARSDGDS